MHPALTEALSRARISELQRESAHHHLARRAAAERPATRTAISRRLAAIRLAALRMAADGRVDSGQPIEPAGPWCLVDRTRVVLDADCPTVTATSR